MKYLKHLNTVVMRKNQQKEIQREFGEKNTVQ